MKLTRQINFELMQKMQEKGFTAKETAEYFNIPLDTLFYYRRTRKMGRFKRYKKGLYDDKIIDTLEVQHLTQTEASKLINYPQSHISKRYKKLKKFRELKEERYKWLKEWESANAVGEN